MSTADALTIAPDGSGFAIASPLPAPVAETPASKIHPGLRSLPIDAGMIEQDRIINLRDAQTRKIEKELRAIVLKLRPDLFSHIPSVGGNGWLAMQFREAVTFAKEKLDIETKPKVVVTITDSDDINACIYPSEQPVLIEVTRGLLKFAKSVDEVAGILAHELQHKNIRDTLQRRAGYRIPLTALMPSSKGEELAADSLGLEDAARAQYNPMGSIQFWQRMIREFPHDPDKYEGGGPTILREFKRAHPHSENRIAALELKLAKHTLFTNDFPLNLETFTPLSAEVQNFNRRTDKLHISDLDLFLPADYATRPSLEQLKLLTQWVKGWPQDLPHVRPLNLQVALAELGFDFDSDAHHKTLTEMTDALEAHKEAGLDAACKILNAVSSSAHFSKVHNRAAGPLRTLGAHVLEYARVCREFLGDPDKGTSSIDEVGAAVLAEFKKAERFFGRRYADTVLSHHGKLNQLELENLLKVLPENSVAYEALWVLGANDQHLWGLVPDSALEKFRDQKVIYSNLADFDRKLAIAKLLKDRHEKKRVALYETPVTPENFVEKFAILREDLFVADREIHSDHKTPQKSARLTVYAYFQNYVYRDDPVFLEQLRTVLKETVLPGLRARKGGWEQRKNNSDSPNYGILANDPLMQLVTDHGAKVLDAAELHEALSYGEVSEHILEEARGREGWKQPESLAQAIEQHGSLRFTPNTPYGHTYRACDLRRCIEDMPTHVLSDNFWTLIETRQGAFNDAYYNAMGKIDRDDWTKILFAPPQDNFEVFKKTLNAQVESLPLQTLSNAYVFLQNLDCFPDFEFRAAMAKGVGDKIEAVAKKDLAEAGKLAFSLLSKPQPIRDLKLRDRLADVYVGSVAIGINEQVAKEGWAPGRDNAGIKLLRIVNAIYDDMVWNPGGKVEISSSINKRDQLVVLKKFADAVQIQPQHAWLFTERQAVQAQDMLAAHVPLTGIELYLEHISENRIMQQATLDFFATDDKRARTILLDEIMAKEQGSLREKLGLTKAEGLHDRARAAIYLEEARTYYLSMPMETRTAVLSMILVPGKQRVDDKMYGEAVESAFSYVIDRMIPKDATEADGARSFLKSYLSVSESFEKVPLLAGMLAAREEGLTGTFNMGEVLARIFAQLGPAYVKLGQGMPSHPDCPKSWRKPLTRLKGKSSDEARWELLARIQKAMPARAFKKITHFGAVIGSASFNTAIRIRRGKKNRILLLEHENARARAKKGFNTLAKTVANWDDATVAAHKSTAIDMLKEGEAMSLIETDTKAGDTQYRHAKDAYDGISVSVADGNRTLYIELLPVRTYRSGDGYREIDEAPGIHFEDFPKGPDKRLIAKGYFAYEAYRAASGQVMDWDRHGQQLKITETAPGKYRLGLYDFGGMMLKAPTIAESKALIDVSMDVYQQAARGEKADIPALMNAAIARADPSARRYLSGIRKSWIALQDFAKHLTPADYKDIADSILAAPLPKEILAYAIEKGMKAVPQARQQDTSFSLASLFSAKGFVMAKEILTAPVQASRIVFQKGGRILRPGIIQRAVQNRVRSEIGRLT